MLALHLKRFEGTMGKITRHVEFPERLSLLEFLSPDSPERDSMAAARQAALDAAVEARAKAKADAEAAAAAAAREAAEREAREAAARRRFRGGGWRGGGRGLLGPPPRPPPRPGPVNGLLGPSPPLSLANGLQSPPRSGTAGAQTSAGHPPSPGAAEGLPPEEAEEDTKAADEAAAAAAEAAASPDYSLCGVLVHQGFAASQGHYYAFVKDGQGGSSPSNSHSQSTRVTSVVSAYCMLSFPSF